MTSILADNQYTLEFYKNIEENYEFNELEQNIIDKINKLSSRVGAPSYQKTPVFKRAPYHYKKNKKENTSNEDWVAMRNFKKTKLEKNTEGIAAQMDKIRSNLNKLTDKTYDIVFDNIQSIIKEIIEENNISYLENIGQCIFEIGSFHKFWSNVYAKLYKNLIDIFPIMKKICIKNFENLRNIFDKINYIDANENYNLYCEYNKENEKRRALSNFLVICASYDIINKVDMQNIIFDFISFVKRDIIEPNKVNHVDEIVQNISIMLNSGKSFLKDMEKWDSIIEEISILSEMNPKEYPSLTNKIVFKFMDLLDDLED